jgi:hypothetical protein
MNLFANFYLRWAGSIVLLIISDSAHGGKQAALEKAIECGNQLEELGKPRTDWVVVGDNNEKQERRGWGSPSSQAIQGEGWDDLLE